jgi:hypothetical protein
MAENRSGSFVSKLVLVLIALGIAALGAWMIVDPSGFMEGADASTGSSKARFLKTALNFAIDSIGVRPTGGVLAAVGLGVMWLALRPGPQQAG